MEIFERVQQTGRPVSAGYRPQLLWLARGPLLGAFSGAVVATVLLWGALLLEASSPGVGDVGAGIVAGLVLGTVFGGISGGAVGMVVGVPMAFLVGRHLSRDVAVRRAYVLGAVLPPLTLFTGTVVLFDAAPTVDPADYGWLIVLLASALLGSRLAAWLAGKDDASRPVS